MSNQLKGKIFTSIIMVSEWKKPRTKLISDKKCKHFSPNPLVRQVNILNLLCK
jgi:hypothetical protein